MSAARTTTITREGWIYLLVVAVLFAAAMLRDINLLLVLVGMLAATIVLNGRGVMVALRGLEVKRKLPERIRAGDLMEIELEVRHARRWTASWAVVVEDRITRLEGGRATEVITVRVPYGQIAPRRSVSLSYRGRLARRGKYAIGPLRAATRFSFGLLSSTRVIEQLDTLVVYPRIGRLRRPWSRLAGMVQVGSRQSERRQGLLEGDFHGLRDWRSGDSRRWIHWRTSARRAALMVRQFERQRNQDLALILDLWQPQTPTAEHRSSVELAISFAATIIADACRQGSSHLLIAAAAQTPLLTRGPASMALWEEAMESLAVVEATSADRLPDVLNQALDAVRPGATTIVIGTRPLDLTDTSRFAAIWSDPRKRTGLSRIALVNAAEPELDSYFQPE